MPPKTFNKALSDLRDSILKAKQYLANLQISVSLMRKNYANLDELHRVEIDIKQYEAIAKIHKIASKISRSEEHTSELQSH